MQKEEAVNLVNEAYALVLNRPADDESLPIQVEAILSGDQSGFALMKTLILSEEAQQLRDRARRRATPALACDLGREIHFSLLGREPDEDMLRALVLAVESEYIPITGLHALIMNTPALAAHVDRLPSDLEMFVADSYRMILGRDPDTVEIGLQADALLKGGQNSLGFIRSLLHSDERVVRERRQKMTFTPDNAKECLEAVFRGLLGREPEPDAIESIARRAGSEDITILEVCIDIISSPEFAARSATMVITRSSAEACLVPVFRGLLGREPEPEAIEALKLRVDVERVTVPELCAEIINSPEFAIRARSLPAVAEYLAQQAHPAGGSDEIVLFLQDLIAIRLTERGCQWALPPIFPTGQNVPTKQIAGLIRTLTMLGDVQNDRTRQ